MDTPIRQVRNIVVGLIASTCILSFAMPSALAGTIDGTIAGVRTNNNLKVMGLRPRFCPWIPLSTRLRAISCSQRQDHNFYLLVSIIRP